MGDELPDLSSGELGWVTKTEKCDLVWTTTETTIPWHQHCATAREKRKTEKGKQKTKKEIGNDNKDNFSASPTLLSGKKNENQQVEKGKYENRSAEGYVIYCCWSNL
jgi:hypothetical protein